MAELARMIEARRGDAPYDDLAREINLKTPTLFRFLKGERGMGIDSVRKVAAWAKLKDDHELIYALASYALGFDIENSG